jgi:hypothetical protein
MPQTDQLELPPLSPLELWRIAPLPEAAHLAGMSVDTLERYHGDKIIRLSQRLKGMRVGDALRIPVKRRDPPPAAEMPRHPCAARRNNLKNPATT